jgi:glycerol-3-phosphate acyltransferase PlsY
MASLSSSWLALGVVIAYSVGSIPTGYWLGKVWKGIDVRQQGSGNLGATNVFRVLGKGPGLFTLSFDILKGAIPVLIAKHLEPAHLEWAVAVGLAAIIGHTTSPFVGFRGGKGVATSAGVFAALLPLPSLISLVTFAVALALSRMVSASSLLAAITLTLSAFFLTPHTLLVYAAAAMTCLVIWTHRSNIRRILSGTESRIGSKGTA